MKFPSTTDFCRQSWRTTNSKTLDVPQSKKPRTIPFENSTIKVIRVTNVHYGPSNQLLSPYEPLHMFDGFELDFQFFRINNSVRVEISGKHSNKFEFFISQDVKAYAGNRARFLLEEVKEVSELRLRVFPDGGMHRLMLF